MLSEPGPVTLTWTPRAAELADAQFARSRDIGGTGFRALLSISLALMASVLLVYRATAAFGVMLIVLALVLAFFRVTKPLVRRRWAALLEANSALAESCEVTFDTAGVHLSSNRVSHTRSWAAFSAWSDQSDAVVLSTSANALGNLLVVPHRAATNPSDVERLRDLVQAHLGPAQGVVPGRARTAVVTWTARVVVILCLVVPLGAATLRVHDQGGEWSAWPSEAPPELHRDGVTYLRDAGEVTRPDNVTGSDYTPGGGLVVVTWPPLNNEPPLELWVLDHEGVYRHYVARTGDSATD